MTVSDKELERRIRSYLTKAGENKLPIYPLRDKGIYRVLGGEFYQDLGIFRGRYIDVLTEAVQNLGFWNNDNKCRGYVEKVNPKVLARVEDNLLKRLETRK